MLERLFAEAATVGHLPLSRCRRTATGKSRWTALEPMKVIGEVNADDCRDNRRQQVEPPRTAANFRIRFVRHQAEVLTDPPSTSALPLHNAVIPSAKLLPTSTACQVAALLLRPTALVQDQPDPNLSDPRFRRGNGATNELRAAFFVSEPALEQFRANLDHAGEAANVVLALFLEPDLDVTHVRRPGPRFLRTCNGLRNHVWKQLREPSQRIGGHGVRVVGHVDERHPLILPGVQPLTCARPGTENGT